MSGVTLPLAAAAGVLSFASPCFLPIVPVYVGYIVGEPGGERASRRRAALAQSLAFVAGFTGVFVALWASLGMIGYALGDYRGWLRVAGGAVLIVMGLHLVGLIRLSVLQRDLHLPIHPVTDGTAPPTYRRSALLGVAFAAGWTPCVGPVLGGVIGMASTGDSLTQGIGLLLTYSLGLGLPFVLVALGATEFRTRLAWLQRHQRAVATVSGAMLMGIGFLMITDDFARLSGLTPALGL